MKHTDKPRILILTSSFPRTSMDDTCGYIREFARSLCPNFAVSVLAPGDRAYDDRCYQELSVARSWSPIPLRWDPLRGSSDLNMLSRGTVIRRLCFLVSVFFYLLQAFAAARKAALVCCHWMLPSGIIGLLCWRILGRPFVIIEHSGGLHLLRGSPAGIRIARMLVLSARRTYVVSKDLKEKLIDIAPEMAGNVEVVPMGVDCALYLKTTQDDGLESEVSAQKGSGQSDETVLGERLKVLFVGRLTAIKGADTLIRAAAELPCIDITIAGDGEARDTLKRLAESLEVPVRFTGYVDRAKKRVLIKDCDVVVVPSILLNEGRSEGLPVACLEGMAAAKPVVASRTGGLADLIEDGDNGLLFEPGDHKMLGSKLQQLYEQPCLRLRLGARAAGTAQDYDWTIIGERFRKGLARLL